MRRKLKVLIVENNPKELKILLENLNHFSELLDMFSLRKANSYAEAFQTIIQSEGFDISIMELNLGKNRTCFDLIRLLPDDTILGSVVLQTSYREMMRSIVDAAAFKGRKIFYLEKGKILEGLVKVFTQLMSYPDKFDEENESEIIEIGKNTYHVKYEHMICFEVDDSYTTIYFKSNSGDILKSSIRQPLTDILKKFNYPYFIQSHRSFAFNSIYYDKSIGLQILLKESYKEKQLSAWLARDRREEVYAKIRKTQFTHKK